MAKGIGIGAIVVVLVVGVVGFYLYRRMKRDMALTGGPGKGPIAVPTTTAGMAYYYR